MKKSTNNIFKVTSYINSLEARSSLLGNRHVGSLLQGLKTSASFYKEPDFTPFLHQRDNIGRLLSTSQSLRMTEKKLGYLDASKMFRLVPKLHLVNPVKNIQKKKESVPALGSYFKPCNWMKQSYSKKMPHMKKEKSPVASLNIKVFQQPAVKLTTKKLGRIPLNYNTVGTRRRKNKYDKILPENQVKLRQRTSISSLDIVGTPEEIGEALKFAKAKESTRNISAEISRVFSELNHRYYKYC